VCRRVDIQPPVLSCPGPTIETSTDKGKPTAKVKWSVQVTDNSVQVDPNAVIQVRSSNQSGQEFPIGANVVKVTATDEAGNIATCSFHIAVRGKYFLHRRIFGYNICHITEYERLIEFPMKLKSY